jgi:hypothetical protein
MHKLKIITTVAEMENQRRREDVVETMLPRHLLRLQNLA